MGLFDKLFGNNKSDYPSEPARNARHKIILLADQSITIQKIIELMLADHPYDLVVVRDVGSLRTQSRALKMALIILDSKFDGFDGFKLCEELKDDPAVNCPPVMILENSHDPYAGPTFRQTADCILKKPFEPQEFLDQVRELTRF